MADSSSSFSLSSREADSSSSFSLSSRDHLAHLILLDADGCTCHEEVSSPDQYSELLEKAKSKLLHGPLKSK